VPIVASAEGVSTDPIVPGGRTVLGT